jgi:cupin 2 domain-containing protein
VTKPRGGNLYRDIPAALPGELFEPLAEHGQGCVERIVSRGHASPPGFWYDQDEHEWVVLLKGRAGLRFEGETEELILGPGDWVEIPAHMRHRVEWTDAENETVWLAVFLSG